MLKKLQKLNPMIRLVIAPLRRRFEMKGMSAEFAWCIAQLVSWSIKALLAIPLWLLGAHSIVVIYLGLVALCGVITASAPWLGYTVKPLNNQ